ncbi:hypothetical protein EV175_006128, partial [Coemansia sp. RSA 1933]
MLWSNLADRFGRKSIYIVSMVVYTCGSIGCALSKSLGALIISRIIQSAGASSAQSTDAGTISDIYPREQRGTALGIYYLGPLLGPFLGPLIGGYIGQDVGWRWVFWVLAILGGVMISLVTFVLPETDRRRVSEKYKIQQINIPPKLRFRANNPLLDIATARYPAVRKRILVEKARRGQEDGDAPIDVVVPAEARLEALWVGSTLILASTIISGWIIDKHLALAGVVVVQFFGFGVSYTYQSIGSYLID